MQALCALLLGSVGAVGWGIRGSDGWDGIEGTIVPGMSWGLLWYDYCSAVRVTRHPVELLL